MSQFALERWARLLSDWEIIAAGLGRTLLTSGLALLLSLALGALFGVMATAGRAPRILNRLYVGAIQNIPLVTLIIFLFYGAPHVGFSPSTFIIGAVGLGIYHGAYMAEVIRAGIQSINRGQLEAALAQGFSFTGAMRHVILPQAMSIVLPPLTNQAVSLIKNTSVLQMISGFEIFHTLDTWASDTGGYGPAYLVAGVIYFLICFPLASAARNWEERSRKARGEVRVA